MPFASSRAVQKEMPRLAMKGDTAACRVACNCVGDSNDDIRTVSLALMKDMAEKDDDITIACACAFLTDPLVKVRNEALTLLSHIASPNNDVAVRAVSGCLNHASLGVQESALRALAVVASKGNKTATSALCNWLQPDSLLPFLPKAAPALYTLHNFPDSMLARLLSGSIGVHQKDGASRHSYKSRSAR